MHQKLTFCERFGLQILPNSEECIFVTPERPFLGVVFGQKEFSRRNGRLTPIYISCNTYSESYAYLRLKIKYLGAILVHPVRRQNFAGKLHIRFYNI